MTVKSRCHNDHAECDVEEECNSTIFKARRAVELERMCRGEHQGPTEEKGQLLDEARWDDIRRVQVCSIVKTHSSAVL